MTSKIIGDAKYQELNMSFTFQQSNPDKLIINAIAENTPYQLEVASNPYLEFEDLKSALISKEFKLLQKSPEILKLKVGLTNFELKNLEKITLNELKQTVADLSSKLKEQTQKNTILEGEITQLKKQFDLMTTKMADMDLKCKQNQDQLVTVKTKTIEVTTKHEQQTIKMNVIEKELEQEKHQRKSIRDELTEQRNTIKLQNELISMQQQKIKAQGQILLEQAISIQKLQSEVELLSIQMAKLNEQKIQSEEDSRQEQSPEKQSEQKKTETKTKNIENAQTQNIVQPKTSLTSSSNKMSKKDNKVSYKFSQQLKSKNIGLSINNSKAQSLNQKQSSDLVVVEGDVLKKGSVIRFKIEKLKKIVRIGLGISDLVAANSYWLRVTNQSNIRHGCFMISDHGWAYSHSNKEQNYLSTFFKYGPGDVIRVETKLDELLFVNQTNKNRYSLSISLTDEQWDKACFCVVLSSKEDSVQIVQ